MIDIHAYIHTRMVFMCCCFDDLTKKDRVNLQELLAAQGKGKSPIEMRQTDSEENDKHEDKDDRRTKDACGCVQTLEQVLR